MKKSMEQIREEIRVNEAKAAKVQALINNEEWIAEVVSPINAVVGSGDLIHIRPRQTMNKEVRAKMADKIHAAVAPLQREVNRIVVKGCEAWIRAIEVEL